MFIMYQITSFCFFYLDMVLAQSSTATIVLQASLVKESNFLFIRNSFFAFLFYSHVFHFVIQVIEILMCNK